jgi:hypothetical protein
MSSIRIARAGAVALAIGVLSGCGGGGGGDATPTAAAPSVTPATPTAGTSSADESSGSLTSFLVNGEGSIATGNAAIDDSGNFSTTSGSTRYQLQQSGGSGCSITSTPADPSVAVCNVLAGGKAFLFCPDTFTPHYTAALFREADVQVVAHWELAGKTLTGLACGPSAPRTTSYSFVFSADAETAMQYTGPSTWGYGSGALDGMERTTTCTLTNIGFCERLVIYKVRNGTATQYFLLVLSQFPSTGAQQPVNLYFLEI